MFRKKMMSTIMRNRWAEKGIRKTTGLWSDIPALRFAWPGHFYSPIPSIEDIQQNEQRIFEIPRQIAGIDLNEEDQLIVLEEFIKYYKDLPFQPTKTDGLRYYFDNPAYSYSDAICLYSMIRYRQPKRIVEVGSGYSSCVVLDTNELFLQGSIETTFIEPYPDLLLSLMKTGDKESSQLIRKNLQDVDLDIFSKLEPNDILFVDSTHVGKIGSDVNYIFFHILPVLHPGVFIHFHDIFYPFEYPKEWVYEGRVWNEAYFLRAFLQYNAAFKIVFFNTFMVRFYRHRFENEMPLCLKNPGGSLWLKKISA